jgi:hypothetical protein
VREKARGLCARWVTLLELQDIPNLDRWQLELAAMVLSHRFTPPEVSITGGATIWSETQMLAAELVETMKRDGRLDEWGNWPR